MAVCSKCDKDFVEGEYLEVDGKAICIGCFKKHSKDHKPPVMICPYCNHKYDFTLRKCPKCKKFNPIVDFYPQEYFINVTLGYLAIFIPILILYLLAILDFRFGSFVIFGLTIILSVPVIILLMLISTIISFILFYIGRDLRDMIFKK